MALSLEDARTLLRTVIRTIDKKADFSASLQEGDHPGVSVVLTLRKHHATVLVPINDLEGAAEDAMRRTLLRNSLKRVMDRMTFESMPVASTKMMRGTVVEGGFFRSQQGNRGGRR